MLKNKVYIVDYELLSPISIGANGVIDSIQQNFQADRPIKKFDTAGIPFKNAAEIHEDLSEFYAQESSLIKSICHSDRMFELIVSCFNMAEKRLQLLIDKLNPERTGVIMGIGADVTPFELFETEIISYLSENNNAIVELFTEINENKSKLNRVINPYDVYAIYLASKFKAAAFQRSVLTACVSSTQAIALAHDSIASGETDVVIAGGTDSLVCTLATIAFGKLGVIPESDNEPSCMPFDVNRRGTLAGECAGFAVLASEKFVRDNQLEKKAQFLAYGNSMDAYKITAPDPGGKSMEKAIRKAVQEAGISANEIDYINAHGTGTKHNDELELKCIQAALGKEASTIPISSTKSRHGHAIAAAGIQELIVLIEMMKHSTIPGNINLKTPCLENMNLIQKNQHSKINFALTNNFAFGGINTVLALKNEMI